jgi:hypothetical protein
VRLLKLISAKSFSIIFRVRVCPLNISLLWVNFVSRTIF